MLDRNREQETETARAEALTLDTAEASPTGRLSVAPIRQGTLDAFEDLYNTLKRQRRSLKRYQVVEALLLALTEEQDVQTEVIKRLK